MSERKKVGLALGSGSAKGLVHIGVLEVLEERRVPIDLITGSSMGSVVGAIYASGTPAKLLHQLAAQICTMDYRKIFDMTMPRKGLVRGARVEAIIRTLTGDRIIEDLKIPYAAVATCLEDCATRVFTTGKVTDAVRASLSIPGVFEPVMMDGKTYVDGGVLDRIPADVARDMGADFVIAVDVGYQGGGRTTPKTIMDVLLSSYELMEWEVMRTRLVTADVVLAPDTSGMSLSSFNLVEEFIARGRLAALAAMEELEGKLAAADIPLLPEPTEA